MLSVPSLAPIPRLCYALRAVASAPPPALLCSPCMGLCGVGCVCVECLECGVVECVKCVSCDGVSIVCGILEVLARKLWDEKSFENVWGCVWGVSELSVVCSQCRCENCVVCCVSLWEKCVFRGKLFGMCKCGSLLEVLARKLWDEKSFENVWCLCTPRRTQADIPVRDLTIEDNGIRASVSLWREAATTPLVTGQITAITHLKVGKNDGTTTEQEPTEEFEKKSIKVVGVADPEDGQLVLLTEDMEELMVPPGVWPGEVKHLLATLPVQLMITKIGSKVTEVKFDHEMNFCCIADLCKSS
ncbi:hypothetical protein NFI96_006602 [Prochilodus magdalenae]|nr:hypothetical protein NFI96_006602 [Prochilodus magdalenae]